MTLTKADIVKELNQYKWLFEGKEAYNLVESLLEIMKRTLESGEDILISGFGKFCVKEKRRGRGGTLKQGRIWFWQKEKSLLSSVPVF